MPHMSHEQAAESSLVRQRCFVPTWYPPVSRPKVPRKESLPPIPDQLFTFTLHSYDFERNTWYPLITIEPSKIYPIPPPPPLDEFIKKKYADYEAKQFELLKAKVIHEEELLILQQEIKVFDTSPLVLGSKFTPEKQKELLMDKQKALNELITTIKNDLHKHATQYAGILDIVNTHFFLEKDYEYKSQTYEASNEHLKAALNAFDNGSAISDFKAPERKNYTLINTVLPIDLPKSTHSATHTVPPKATALYKAPVYSIPQKKEDTTIATPDFKSVELFPSLSSNTVNPTLKKVCWGKSLV